MKRIIALSLALMLLLCGCDLLGGANLRVPEGGMGTDLTHYPVYENLSEKEITIWNNICKAMEAHSTEKIHVGSYATKTEMKNAQQRLNQMMRELSYACPDFFWVNPYSYQVHTLESDAYYELQLELDYLMDADDAAEKKVLYGTRVEGIVAAAKNFTDPFDQIKFVHDTILSSAEYDYELAESDDTTDLGRSAYGCLVEGKTICSGYAMAFRSIMEKLGIECGVEFNSYRTIQLSSDGHVWNWCKLDGEYYYFDLTWDDTGFDSEDYADYLPYSYLYFGISADELGQSTYDLDPDAPTPECNGTKYNYFVHQGLNFAEYDYNAVKSVIRDHRNDPSVTLRFDSYYELEQAKIDLIDNQKVFQILPELNTLSYLVCSTDHHLLLMF